MNGSDYGEKMMSSIFASREIANIMIVICILLLLPAVAAAANVTISMPTNNSHVDGGYDITFILENGKITSKEFNEDVAFQNWTYRITGDDLDGDSGSVVVAIISKSGLLIITVLA